MYTCAILDLKAPSDNATTYNTPKAITIFFELLWVGF